MIMPANHLSGLVHYFAGKYPDKIGMLNSPHSMKAPPFYMKWALDNGAFTNWDERKFLKSLGWAKRFHEPLWVVVPDVVGDAEETMKRWHEWKNRIPFRLAFACQDGMEPRDVPKEAYCAFIGGTTDWKLNNAYRFKGSAPLLHIGRVNTDSRIKWAKQIGADSIDGTGFFRGYRDKRQYLSFIRFFDGSPQTDLFCSPQTLDRRNE